MRFLAGTRCLLTIFHCLNMYCSSLLVFARWVSMGWGCFFFGGGVISSFTLCGSAATVQPSELCLSSERGTPVAARGKPFPTEIGNF